MSEPVSPSRVPSSDDDESIEGSERLFVRLPADTAHVHYDTNRGRYRVASGALELEPDEDGVSVFLESELPEGADPKIILDGHPGYLLGWFTAADVRSASDVLGLRRDPNPADAPPHPCSNAHAIIVGLETLTKNPNHKARSNIAKKSYLHTDPDEPLRRVGG